MPMYALYADDKHIMDVYATDADNAAEQLIKLGEVFTSLNDQQRKYYAAIDKGPNRITLEVLVIKGLAHRVSLPLVKQ